MNLTAKPPLTCVVPRFHTFRWAALGVLLSAGATLWAQIPDRTHRQMELLNGGCQSCHACEAPTVQIPCLRNCSRSEAIRLAQAFEKKRGPKVVILDELEDLYLPVPFDHAGHAEMAKMTGNCAICHHYTPEGLEHPACKTCHSATSEHGEIDKPGLKGAYHRQCMSCHREWSGKMECGACHHPKAGAAAKGGPVATPTPDDLIGRMHPPIPEPHEELYTTQGQDGVATNVLFRHKQHIERYGLRCAECHREDNCNRCHQKEKKHVQHARTFDQHHKPCLECHRNDKCESCHFALSASAPPLFDHGNTGWPLTRYHRDRSCRECHASAPFGKIERACDSCHKNWSPANFDHAVTGQVLNENHARFDCDACHTERRFDRAPVCDQCHEAEEAITFPAKQPGPPAPRRTP